MCITYRRSAVIQVPRTPDNFKSEAIVERHRLFERTEGEVSVVYSICKLFATPTLFLYARFLLNWQRALKDIDNFEKRFKNTDREADK